MEITDSDIIRKILNGNINEFRILVERYQKMIFRTCMGFIHNSDDAEDLTQEVFLRVFQAAPNFKPKAKVSSWVFTIAYNLSTNELKRRKRMRGFHTQISAEGWGLRGRTSASLTEAGNLELEERLMAAMGQLPENQRAALLLKTNEGLTYLEISNVLGVSVASVESLIYRARSRLKQLVRASAGNCP